MSGEVGGDGVGVLSLHLLPQKCRGCGELRWSESSSAWLKSKIEEDTCTSLTLSGAGAHTQIHKTHTDASQEACELLRGVSDSD